MARPKKDGLAVQSYSDKAYLYIKGLIMSYALKPGETISEIAIARTLQMSRTPVHQAFLHLKREGFLNVTPGAGWRVYSLSLLDIREIFSLKTVIEQMIVAEVAAKDSFCKKGIRDCLSRMQKAASERKLDEWMKADQELHDTIFALSNNSRAVRIIKGLNEQWYRFQNLYVPLDLAKRQSEHNAFVSCILSGDAQGAQRQYKEHLTHARMEIEYILQKMIFPLSNDLV